MEPVPSLSATEQQMNQILIDFYVKHAKLQQQVWSCTPIKTIPRYRRTQLISKAFYNWEFDITKGTEKNKETISFADFPLMNQSDWITTYQIFVLRADDTLKPQIQVFKLLMQNYMYEMGKYDLIVAEIMKKVPNTVEPIYVDYGLNADGLITKDPWGIVVKITTNNIVKFGHLMMTDLYTLNPSHLVMLKQKIFLQNRNSEQDKQAVYRRIVWYEAVCSKIITFHNFMREHEEK